MSDNKSKIEKITNWFKKNNIPATVVVVDEKAERLTKLVAFHKDPATKTVEKYEALKLVDGVTKITIEPAVEVGAACVIETAEGPVPAPIGEYELSDNRVIVVAEPGIIAEVKDAVDPNAKPVEEPMAEQKELNTKVKSLIERTEREQIFAKVVELGAANEKLTKENTRLNTELVSVNEKFSKFEGLLTELFEEESKQPVVKKSMPFEKEKKKNMFQPTF